MVGTRVEMAPLRIPGANEEGHRKIDLGEGNVAVALQTTDWTLRISQDPKKSTAWVLGAGTDALFSSTSSPLEPLGVTRTLHRWTG